jgi:hypothetical protein
MRLDPGEFTDLTYLEEEFFRYGYGRTSHDPINVDEMFFLAKFAG